MINKRSRINIAIIVLGIIALFLVEYFRPKPIDWRQGYEAEHKTPFGCFALHEFLEDIFPNQKIDVNQQSLYETLRSEKFKAETQANLIIITDILKIDKFVTENLIGFMEQGNNVFIAAHDINNDLKDTLNIAIRWSFSLHPSEINDTVFLRFVNPNIKKSKRTYAYNRGMHTFKIESFDTANTHVLGETKDEGINFIKTKVGKGSFFLNTSPMAFGNMNLIEARNHDYAFVALSHLPIRKTIWDEFYKPLRKKTASPINYILSQPALKSAYILLIIAIFIFIIFESKRKQKYIPVIEPKKNSTLQFVDALSRMYYFRKNHKDIAIKKYTFLLEYIRSKYYLKTAKINEVFIANLSYKTGIDQEEINKTFTIINYMLEKNKINEPELHRINNLIENFYKKTIR